MCGAVEFVAAVRTLVVSVTLELAENAASVLTLELTLRTVAPTAVFLVRVVAAVVVVVAAPPTGDAARVLALEVGRFAFGFVWKQGQTFSMLYFSIVTFKIKIS